MKSGPPTTRRATDLLSRVGLAPWILLIGALLPLPGADGKIASLPSFCAFHTLTGLPCPGCGLTRAVVCLCHGRLSESLAFHPLALGVLGVAAAYPFLRNKPKIQTRLLIGLTLVLLVAWPIRLFSGIAASTL